MAHYKQTFRVNASLSAVWDLHESPAALPELTPPPVHVTILEIDQPLKKGSRLKFRLGIGPMGTVWHAIYDEFTPYQPGLKQCGFVDRSLSSPFHFWTHRHTFDALEDGISTVTDDATFEVVGGPLGGLITLLAWPAIAFMFLYRRQKTRKMLASGWHA